MMAKMEYVGKNMLRVDAREKAIGKAKYTSEEAMGRPGMLYAKALFSPHAHAKILSIDIREAERLPGVKAVFIGKDTPEYRAGVIIDDRHVLCRDTVRFVGDAVAVVAAENAEIAEEAVDLIKVRYKILPAIFDAEEAMKPDCKVVLHPDSASYERPIFKYLGNDLPGSNVHTHHKVRKGNVEEGFKKSYLVVEHRFQNDRMTHCQMEPYNCVCYPENDGSYTMWTSGRCFENQGPIARAYGLSPDKLRMRCVYAGGMFGQVARPERFALMVAMKTGKPVKMVYSRAETFIDGLNRLPKVVYVKDGVSKDGTLLAREIKVIVNTGGYTNLAPLTIRNGSFHASQYRIPHFKWDAYGVYTNEPACGPLRGFGSAEVLWATEQMMDIVAEKLGIDPRVYRLKNTPDEGEINVRGELIHSIGAKEALEEVSKWIKWGKPSNQPEESHIKTGKGIAVGCKYTMVETASSARVKVHPNGIIEVHHGTDECGQGCNTVFTQMAAECFKMSMDNIRLVWGDTAGPYDAGAISSRSTMYVGNAIVKACDDAKRQLFELAAPRLKATPDKMDTRDGKIFIKGSPSKSVPFCELFLAAHPEARGAVKASTCLEEGAELIGRGTFWGRPGAEDPETGQGDRLTISYCYGAQSVEVAVDTETGVVKILKFASSFDAGMPMNPKLCEAQIDGAMAMGVGSGLWEGYVFDGKGTLLNPNLHDYKIATSMDVPCGDNFASFIIEDPHKEGPFGAKGMGEAGMNPTAPAIANAIYNATGARVHHLPMTPERVLAAIKMAKKSKK
ncbi:xanthine dehydrogenase family protein molybdopterin-binding subunit [Chloroflexota bacterium]